MTARDFELGHRARSSTAPTTHLVANRIMNRVTPPEIAPNVAPFLPPVRAPTAVAIPAVPAIIKASRFQDRRRPPPHTRIFAFIGSPLQRISGFVLHTAFRGNRPSKIVSRPPAGAPADASVVTVGHCGSTRL